MEKDDCTSLYCKYIFYKLCELNSFELRFVNIKKKEFSFRENIFFIYLFHDVICHNYLYLKELNIIKKRAHKAVSFLYN